MKSTVEFRLHAPSFAPSEVAKISGVSTVTQRDWRRRGLLPKSKSSEEKWTRFNAWPLLVMWTSKLMADRGVALQEGMRFSASAGVHVFWHALMRKAAYTGGHEFTYRWMPDDTLAKMARLRTELPEVVEGWRTYAKVYCLPEDPTKIAPADNLWLLQAEFLARKIFRAFRLEQVFETDPGSQWVPPRYLIWTPNGAHVASISLDVDFQGFVGEAGASIVLDLYAMATAFLERAGRPLIKVEYKLWADETLARERAHVSSIIKDAELIAHGFEHGHQATIVA